MSEFDLKHHGDEIIILYSGDDSQHRAWIKIQTGIGEHRTTKITAPTGRQLQDMIALILRNGKGRAQ